MCSGRRSRIWRLQIESFYSDVREWGFAYAGLEEDYWCVVVWRWEGLVKGRGIAAAAVQTVGRTRSAVQTGREHINQMIDKQVGGYKII